MFEKFFKNSKEENFPDPDLILLSDLDFDELENFKNEWLSLDTVVRQEIITRTFELAEESVDLDFTSLFRLALDDPDNEVKESAILGLWESEERRVIPKLSMILRQDPQISIRIAAAKSLGHFALMAVTGKLIEKDSDRIYKPLIEALQDEDEPIDLRRRALESVSVFQNDDTTNWILWAYQNENVDLKQSAVFSMGKSCNPIWVATIVEELTNEEPSIRYEAATAAGEQLAESAVPHLIDMITDQDIEVRTAVVQSLGAIGGRLAKKALQTLLESEDDFTKEIAQEALTVADLDQPGVDMSP